MLARQLTTLLTTGTVQNDGLLYHHFMLTGVVYFLACQLSVSMLRMTLRVCRQPWVKGQGRACLGFQDDPNACSTCIRNGGEDGLPPSRLISPLGLGSRQKHIDPQTKPNTHARTHTPRIHLVINQNPVVPRDVEEPKDAESEKAI